MKNADLFKDTFGMYATEIWSMPEKEFLIWLNENAQPKTGHWIYDYTAADGHRTYHCSECGCSLKQKHSEPLNSFKWCSLCGARMVESQKRSDKE